MKRVIFDLDGTLLTGSFEFEKEYFTSVYGEDAIELVDNMFYYLDEYEKSFPRYNHEWLGKFLTEKSGFKVNDKVIDGWIDAMSKVPDTMEDGVIETLENLKRKDCSLAVLTNWYGMTQIPRLRKAGILHYFDNIYTGEFVLKPHEKSYVWAKDDFDIEDCLFVGDNLDKDYIGPRIYGFESVLYDKNDKHGKTLKKIKRIDEIIDKDLKKY
jgi:FMN phosphatase YigB (HAD superfamily)